ncbi:MAG: TIGR04283 family arsenosugar biosynthesis glycosyltransferase [Pseudomonadota bacterium]
MPAPISVVIPTLHARDGLRKSLPPLVEGVAEGLIHSVVFADGGSNDGVNDIAEETGAEVVVTKPGRGTQLRAGIEAAKGDWILVLHADTVLPPQWTDHISRALNAPDRAHVFRLSFDVAGFAPSFVAGWANLRTRFFGLPYGDQGILLTKSLYQQVGGYQDIPLMEDVALAKALKGRITLLDATVVTSAERYLRDGWFRRGARNIGLLLRYKLGADPKALANRYRSPAKKP